LNDRCSSHRCRQCGFREWSRIVGSDLHVLRSSRLARRRFFGGEDATMNQCLALVSTSPHAVHEPSIFFSSRGSLEFRAASRQVFCAEPTPGPVPLCSPHPTPDDANFLLRLHASAPPQGYRQRRRGRRFAIPLARGNASSPPASVSPPIHEPLYPRTRITRLTSFQTRDRRSDTSPCRDAPRRARREHGLPL